MKVCNTCGTSNSSQSIRCANCGQLLIGGPLPGSKRTYYIIISVIVLLIIAFPIYYALRSYIEKISSITPISPIGVNRVSNENIGISDGTFAFDIYSDRLNRDLKRRAAEQMKMNNLIEAAELLDQAIKQDPNDAEAHIYRENIKVLTSPNPHLTLVVGGILLPNDVVPFRDTLQGAYIAQKECNEKRLLPGNMLLRVLIANSGSDEAKAEMVAQQIVSLKKDDETFVGVMGWSNSESSTYAMNVLNTNRIPMVSPIASSDELSGRWSYFFRVAPTDTMQGSAGAKYAVQKLRANTAVLLVDREDSYSNSLATAFQKQFEQEGKRILLEENYDTDNVGTITDKVNSILAKKADIIYYAGRAPGASVLLANLPTNLPNFHVMGGDSLYSVGQYNDLAKEKWTYLKITTFAYPDAWGILNEGPEPSFFTSYAKTYNPKDDRRGEYGYGRADYIAILSFDAMQALIRGCELSYSGPKTVTPEKLQQGLTQIKGNNNLQGVSGLIEFDDQGNSVNKAVVILYIEEDTDGKHFKMEPEIYGQFKITSSESFLMLKAY